MFSNEILGKLKAVEGTMYVTHKAARAQIREICKAKGIKVGLFNPKKENPTTISIPLADGTGCVTSKRVVGADICLVKTLSAAEIPADVLAQVEAEGKKGEAKLQTAKS